MKRKNKTYFFLAAIVFIIIPSLLWSQETKGIIIDTQSGKTIASASLWIKGTTKGTSSNAKGEFSLNVYKNCILYFSSVGYENDSLTIGDVIPEFIVKKLTPKAMEIKEVLVTPNYSYDKQLYKRIIKNKEENKKELTKVKFYTKDRITSVLLSTDSQTKWTNKNQLNQYKIAIDSNSSKQMLPVYVANEVIKVEQQIKTITTQTINKKKEGIFPMLNQQIESLVLSKIAIDFNFYKNQIVILDRGFISPLSNNALLYYNIYLSDSLEIDGQNFYKFRFYPKNQHAIVFDGHMWVEDGSFALCELQASLPPNANLNFIKNLKVTVNYRKTENDVWFYNQQQVTLRFSLNTSTTKDKDNDLPAGEFFIQKKTLYNPKGETTIKTNNLFNTAKPLTINTIENKTIENIHQIKNNPVVRNIDNIGGLLLSGYYSKGIIDIGPSFDMYATNRVEGDRYTLPLRTNEHLFKNISLGGFLGYASKTEELKYGGQIQIGLTADKSHILSLKYTDEYYNVSDSKFINFVKENPFSRGQNNLITAITAGVRNPYIIGKKKIEAIYESHHKDFDLVLNPYHHTNSSTPFIPFIENTQYYDTYYNYGVLLNFRFSFDQTYNQLYFSRLYYTNLKPVINLSFDYGKAYTPHSSERISTHYLHTHISMKMRFNFGISYIKLMANAGYIYGDVPYTMLETPAGSQSLGFARFSYNLLNQASYAHNLYTNIHLNINGGGFILNHIPIIEQWQWREMASLKCYYGTLSSNYNGMFTIPNSYNHQLSEPYTELGIGVSNIFRILRIEYIRRLSNERNINSLSSKQGVRIGIEISF